ncbi:hypothetical protein pdam_00020296, partial [Pocillopora damicornis]
CACCCCPTVASCCCACCPSCRSSTSTRIVYTLFLLIGTILSSVMLSSGIQDTMVEKVPFFNEACEAATLGTNCDVLVGYLAVYRICFGMAAFFFLFMILNIGVGSSKDCRGELNNGFWGLKFILLITLWVAAFFIPRGSFGVGLFFFMFLFYALALTGFILSFVFFTQ